MPEPETKPTKFWTGYVDLTARVRVTRHDECDGAENAIKIAMNWSNEGTIIKTKAVPDS